MPHPVSCVCQYDARHLVVGVGLVLAVYELEDNEKLVCKAYIPCRAVITSLSVSGSGLIFAADKLAGVVVYRMVDVMEGMEGSSVSTSSSLDALWAQHDVRSVLQVAAMPWAGSNSSNSLLGCSSSSKLSCTSGVWGLCLDADGCLTEIEAGSVELMSPVRSMHTTGIWQLGVLALGMTVRVTPQPSMGHGSLVVCIPTMVGSLWELQQLAPETAQLLQQVQEGLFRWPVTAKLCLGQFGFPKMTAPAYSNSLQRVRQMLDGRVLSVFLDLPRTVQLEFLEESPHLLCDLQRWCNGPRQRCLSALIVFLEQICGTC
jgi:hypothetical protein